MKVSNAIKKFLIYSEIEKQQSKKTIENYDLYLRRFLEFYGDENIEKLSLSDVQNYRVFLNRYKNENDDTLGKKTQNYHVIALRSLLKYLSKNDVNTLSPEKIDLGKTPERSVEFLSQEEVERLLNSVPKKSITDLRNLAILETLYSTGLRISELVSLNIEDIDLDRGEFMVRGKGDKPRPVFLSQSAIRAIRQYLEARQDTYQPLFISHGRSRTDDMLSKGEKLRLTAYTIQEMVRKHGRLAGLNKKVTPHTLSSFSKVSIS